MPQIEKNGTMEGRTRDADTSRRTRIDVLDTFEEECFCPTPHDLARWESRYPQYSEDLRKAAAEIISIRVMTGRFRPDEAPGPTPEDFDREMTMIPADLGKRIRRRRAPGVDRS